MKPELLSLLSFAIGIAAYTISQLQQHGKLRFNVNNKRFSFWGEDSDKRKYKGQENDKLRLIIAPSNWYYKLINSPYKERWFTSTWLTVALTDGYHFMQFLFFLFISLSVVPLLNWTYGIAFWILAHVIHAILYRTLQR